MKELVLYYSFFKSSFSILFATTVVGIIIGYVFYLQQTPVYTTIQLFELYDENKSGDEKIAVAEEVIGLLREKNISQSYVQDLYISRVAPFAVKVILRSNKPQVGSENLDKISLFLNERGNFITVGNIVESISFPSLFLFISIGLTAGLGFGLCIALMKTYIRSY